MKYFIAFLTASEAALIGGFLLLASAFPAHAETSCDEWANFAKIVTFKGRDTGIPIEQIKRSAEINSPNPSENETAFKWIDFVYDNPDMLPVDVWHNVYAQCLVKFDI
jgi:hypothetical protein